MRWYNGNPQVTMWREKYESLKAENEELKDEISHLTLDVNRLENTLQERKEFYEYRTNLIEARVKESFQEFNSLPWHKKMFYRFKL